MVILAIYIPGYRLTAAATVSHPTLSNGKTEASTDGGEFSETPNGVFHFAILIPTVDVWIFLCH